MRAQGRGNLRRISEPDKGYVVQDLSFRTHSPQALQKIQSDRGSAAITSIDDDNAAPHVSTLHANLETLIRSAQVDRFIIQESLHHPFLQAGVSRKHNQISDGRITRPIVRNSAVIKKVKKTLSMKAVMSRTRDSPRFITTAIAPLVKCFYSKARNSSRLTRSKCNLHGKAP